MHYLYFLHAFEAIRFHSIKITGARRFQSNKNSLYENREVIKNSETQCDNMIRLQFKLIHDREGQRSLLPMWFNTIRHHIEILLQYRWC